MEDSGKQLETQMSALVRMTPTHLKRALVNAIEVHELFKKKSPHLT